MNNEQVTAKWARETAQAQIGQEVSSQLEKCLNAIKEAVKRNEMNVSVNIYARPLTLTELQNRGFSVKQVDDQRDGSYVNINW